MKPTPADRHKRFEAKRARRRRKLARRDPVAHARSHEARCRTGAENWLAMCDSVTAYLAPPKRKTERKGLLRRLGLARG
jgi:hypothetical protein